MVDADWQEVVRRTDLVVVLLTIIPSLLATVSSGLFVLPEASHVMCQVGVQFLFTRAPEWTSKQSARKSFLNHYYY